ncbi:MAG: cell wall-binding repeat-containing protein, partial [Pseudomonadota bacterium]|nr:cell wall-binding repeat-containing protein [Pseudomonadota bacterium]
MSTKSRTRVAGKSLRKAGVGGAALTLAAATAIAGAGVANANATFSFDRIAGPDRAATSAQTAAVFGASTEAILANGSNEHTVDALSAAYLAGVKKAPILLTKNAIQPVPSTVLAQLQASGVKNVTVVGGLDAITAAQVTQLTDAGYTVTRIGGATRFDTSNNIIAAAGAASGNTALLTTGRNFADALGASTLSYAKKIPVAITEPASVKQSTLDTLKAAGITNIIVAGGTSAVSQNVRDQLVAAGFTVDNT